jgi:diaminopimelate decarboxylase
MNDLLRPALYGAYHDIDVVDRPRRRRTTVDVVGPVCESGDSFAQNRAMPELQQGDLLALRTAGAYGFSMASTYNSRPRPAEVLVDGAAFTVVRERERLEDLWRGELSGLAAMGRGAVKPKRTPPEKRK